MNDTSGAGIPLLAARSWYSLMSAALPPESLVSFAASAGFGSLALTDENNLYALPLFVDAASEKGLKPIAGASISVDGRRLAYIWVLDRSGYSRLCLILSRMLYSPKNPRQKPRLPDWEGDESADEPTEYQRDEDIPPGEIFSEAVVLPESVIVGCENYDPIEDLVSQGWAGLAVASACPDILKRLRLARHLAQVSSAERRERPWLFPLAALESGRGVMELARYAADCDLESVAVAGGCCLSPDDAERMRYLAAIEKRVSLSALGGVWSEPGPEEFLPDLRHAENQFSAFYPARELACRIAATAMPASEFLSLTPVFPAYEGFAEEESFRLLRSQCLAAVPRRFPADETPPELVHARLERELSIIRGKGFSAYFLVVRDIVSTCPRTCGRGSAAASIVSYLLGITHVDPLAHDLFFERFLNEGRSDLPDIDVDFPWDERHAVLNGVFRKYAGRVAMVADHCRFSGRSRVREPAVAMGKSPEEIDALVRAWRYGNDGALPPPLAKAAALLDGVPRYIGTHPGGVVITPGPITDYTHIQPSLLGFPVLAWEKDGTERSGLVKIDLLGNRSLAVLRDCISLVSSSSAANGASAAGGEPAAETKGSTCDIPVWESFNPVKEPCARDLIESGATIGIFYIESPATRQLLAKMQNGDYEHLVAASSIIRPAANKYINEYVRRLRGGSWKHLAPQVEAVLAETYGIMVYQEDVSRVAMAAAGFSGAEADVLRKVLTKKRKGLSLENWHDRFFSGCGDNGIANEETVALWEMMQSFLGYSFCKAHSASYALVSYRLAWMKARYPGYFIVSVINNGGGFYSTQTYLDEARRLGYRLIPPCVNASERQYVAIEECGESLSGRACRGRIHTGLMQIRDVSSVCIARLIEERRLHGLFADVADFLNRVLPSIEDCRALVRSGAMDFLETIPQGSVGDTAADKVLHGIPARTRPQLLWIYHQWRRGRSKGAQSRNLAGLCEEWSPPSCISDYSPAIKLRDEADFLGVLVSVDTAGLFKRRSLTVAERRHWPAPVDSSQLTRHIGRQVSLLGIATAGKEVVASTGDSMCFRSFTDTDGVFETVLFPNAYRRLMPILENNSAFLLLGTVHEDFNAVIVHIDDIMALNRESRPSAPLMS